MNERQKQLEKFYYKYLNSEKRYIRRKSLILAKQERYLEKYGIKILDVEKWNEDLFEYAEFLMSLRFSEFSLTASMCGCCWCGSIFSPNRVELFEDFIKDRAFCPCCGMDFVIYDAPGIPLTKKFLDRLEKYILRRNF